MEAKGLRVNMGKTKIMVSGVNLQTLKDSGEYPCSVCSNSIYCAGCSHWVHKKCSGVRDANKSTGEKRRYFKYYDDTMNILGDRECVFPTDFAESCNVSVGTSSSTITHISSSSNQAIDDIPAENVVWEEEDEGINGAEQTIHPLPPLTPNVNTRTKRVTSSQLYLTL